MHKHCVLSRKVLLPQQLFVSQCGISNFIISFEIHFGTWTVNKKSKYIITRRAKPPCWATSPGKRLLPAILISSSQTHSSLFHISGLCLLADFTSSLLSYSADESNVVFFFPITLQDRWILRHGLTSPKYPVSQCLMNNKRFLDQVQKCMVQGNMLGLGCGLKPSEAFSSGAFPRQKLVVEKELFPWPWH